MAPRQCPDSSLRGQCRLLWICNLPVGQPILAAAAFQAARPAESRLQARMPAPQEDVESSDEAKVSDIGLQPAADFSPPPARLPSFPPGGLNPPPHSSTLP